MPYVAQVAIVLKRGNSFICSRHAAPRVSWPGRTLRDSVLLKRSHAAAKTESRSGQCDCRNRMNATLPSSHPVGRRRGVCGREEHQQRIATLPREGFSPHDDGLTVIGSVFNTPR
jgi:hypothetical protein